MSRANQPFIGSLFVLLGACGYGFFAIFTKLAYRDSLEPLDVTLWRFIIASVSLWALWPLWRRQANLGTLTIRQIALLLGLGGLLAAVALAGFFGLERVSATTYTLLFYTYPAMVTLTSLMLGERLPLTGWVAVGLALAGCTLTIGGQVVINDFLGAAFVFLNATLYAAYLIIIGRHARGISGLASGAIIIPGSLIALVPLGLIRGLHAPTLLEGWVGLAGLGLISTVLPIIMVFAGITRIGATRAAILSTLEPVLTVILAAALLGERVGAAQYIGGALIITSVFLLHIPERLQTSSTSRDKQAL